MNAKREIQDKIWSELSEESKAYILSVYKELDEEWKKYREEKEDSFASSRLEKLIVLDDIFGEHNLNPEQINTWEDFIKEFHKHTDWCPKNTYTDLPLYGMDDAIKKKMIATAKIAKLIDVTYGGRVTDDEWNDHTILKYYIEPHSETKRFVTHCAYREKKHFVAFHTQKQMEAFLSHESNKQLLKDFFEY